MKTSIRKWGDSLTVRIPNSFATEIGIIQGSTVEMKIVGRKIALEPTTPPEYALEDLLEGVTEDNLHTEVSTGWLRDTKPGKRKRDAQLNAASRPPSVSQ